MQTREWEYLFVYGTLRKNYQNPIRRVLSNSARLLGHGLFQGRLFDAGGYLGALASKNPNDQVPGEVFLLMDPDSLLPVLDCFEGCVPEGDDPPEFVRSRQKVKLEDGRTITTWIYLYNWHPSRLKDPKTGHSPAPRAAHAPLAAA